MASSRSAGHSYGSDRSGNVSRTRVDEPNVSRWRLSAVRAHATDADDKRDEDDSLT